MIYATLAYSIIIFLIFFNLLAFKHRIMRAELALMLTLLLNIVPIHGFSVVLWLYSILAAPGVLTLLFILIRQSSHKPWSNGILLLLFGWNSVCMLGMSGLLPTDIYNAAFWLRLLAVGILCISAIVLDKRFLLIAVALLSAYNLNLMPGTNIIDYSADIILWLMTFTLLVGRLAAFTGKKIRVRIKG